MTTTLDRPRRSTLTDGAWWQAATKRAAYTAIAIALPYLGSATLGGVPWITAALAAALGFVASLVTSLAGLPEAQGVDLPWWLAALERSVKTFAQALGAGFLGAVLITDVDWGTVLQSAAMSTLASLLRLVLATLPADPTIDARDATGVPVITSLGATAVALDEALPSRSDVLGTSRRDGRYSPFADDAAAPTDAPAEHIVGEPVDEAEAAALPPAIVEPYPGSPTVVTYDEHDVPTIHNRADLGL